MSGYESTMTWGDDSGRFEDMGDGTRRYHPPGLGGAMFRGRVGLVIEVAPNRFIKYVLAGTHGALTIETGTEDIYVSDQLAPVRSMTTSRTVRVELAGYLSSEEQETRRPDWATDTAGEIEARRAIEERS